jgi:hypothetical protein
MARIGKLKEEWKCIPDYSGYIVSDRGNIMVLPKLPKNENAYGKVKRETNGRPGHLLSPRPTFHGHLQVCLTNDEGEQKMEYVHRLVAMAFLKNRKGLDVIMHLDDNPSNNVLSNLQWGTQKINLNMVTDRKMPTSKNKMHTTWEIVTTMYNDNKQKYSGNKKQLLKEIAEALDISYGYVSALIYSKNNRIIFSNTNQQNND